MMFEQAEPSAASRFVARQASPPLLVKCWQVALIVALVKIVKIVKIVMCENCASAVSGFAAARQRATARLKKTSRATTQNRFA